MRGDAANVDDRSAAGVDHVSAENLAGLKDRPEVDRHHAVPVGVGCVEEHAAGVHSGAVDQDVDFFTLFER